MAGAAPSSESSWAVQHRHLWLGACAPVLAVLARRQTLAGHRRQVAGAPVLHAGAAQGAGLQNLGNTCFMNAVLQCLAHTAPLAEVVLAGLAPEPSSNPDDPLNVTVAHIRKALTSPNKVLAPSHLARILKTINKRCVGGAARAGTPRTTHLPRSACTPAAAAAGGREQSSQTSGSERSRRRRRRGVPVCDDDHDPVELRPVPVLWHLQHVTFQPQNSHSYTEHTRRVPRRTSRFLGSTGQKLVVASHTHARWGRTKKSRPRRGAS